MFNAHEFAARTIKVDALVRSIHATFRPANGFEAGALAALLTSTTQADRDQFARTAGVRSPSPTTWAQVVKEVVSC